MAGIKVRNLSADYSWGAIVAGVNWDSIADADIRAELNAVFEDRGFIVFTDVEQSGKMQVALSEVFGPLKDHPNPLVKRASGADAALGVIDMHNKPLPEDDDTGKVLYNGRKMKCYSPWHFDHCYGSELNRAGLLRSLIIAPEGGRTGFVDGIELYRQFSPELRGRIEKLNIIYKRDTRLSQLRFGMPEGLKVFQEPELQLKHASEGAKHPRAIHPAVWTRKTGEKVLHVGTWMVAGVEHHEDAEGDALLNAVCQEIRTKAHAYWHAWKQSDMVIWDNWRMLHAVEPIDPGCERRTQRSTIKGDYGLGRFETDRKPAAAV
jgi:taurine dioxygenase